MAVKRPRVTIAFENYDPISLEGYPEIELGTVNSFKAYLSHERGVVSMARSVDVNSAGAQFFIVEKDSDFLDMLYAAYEQVVIKEIRVDLRGYTDTQVHTNY